MLTDAQLREDLEKLKPIAAAHKAESAPLATHTEVIRGIETPVFSKIPENMHGIYRLGLKAADRDFLVYEDQRYSFGESYQLASRLGRVLIEHYDIQKGDRVAICSRNNPQWCLAYMATTMIGAVVVPMNSWWSGPELFYGLEDSGSKLLFADEDRIQRIKDYVPRLSLDIITINPETAHPYAEFFSTLEGVDALSEENLNQLQVQAEDDVSIMYTSGSTGKPKGVLSSHRNITNALYTWLFVKEINEILRPELLDKNPEFPPAMLANVPLFHVTGSHAQFLACFVNLRKFVMMYKWDADKALELIEKERISILHGVPTMTWEVLNSPKFDSTDTRSLRSAASGGAPRPPEHLALMQEKFSDKVLPGLGYGLTETNAIGALISGKFYLTRPNSTGRPTPPVTSIKIIDETGKSLANTEVGEICIKGATVMKAYWNNPVATEEILKDGWFLTGDIGMLDAQGFLIILDRAKDIVIRGGENIGCAEVEYAISEHPLVSEVSVYGVPDNRLGEIVCTSIMLESEAQLGIEDLQVFLKQRIAPFKIPQHAFFQYTQLPRIASGKIAKKELKAKSISELGLD